MKKLISAVALGLALSTAGCASWWNDIKNNPAAVVQSFDDVVNTVMANVAIAWAAAQSVIPAGSLPQVTTDYENAVVSVNNAVAALNAAVQAASDAQQSNPDFTALMANVTSAVNSVITIVDQWGGHVTNGSLASTKPLPGLADAHMQAATLSRWAH